MKRSKFAISIDKEIKAQKPGKRAANKNRETYYEYRENRTDSDLRKKLEWGGTAESSETGQSIGGENASSMYNTGGPLKGNQNKLDLNKNSKLDAEDFKMLRGNKMAKGGGVQSFKKGNKVKTREGKIETIVRKNKNGNYETQESDYTWNPSDLTLVSKMAIGGAMNETFPENDAMSYAKGGGILGDDNHWKNMPKNAAKNLAEYYGNKKLAFNKKELNLSKKDLAELKEVQMMINKYHPEFNHYLSLMHKEHKMALGGSTKGFEYSIGGL